MATNHLEIEINASTKEVWLALTNSKEFAKWMKNIKVQSNWKPEAEIIYTCFDESGNITKWAGMDMIWKGIIKIIYVEKEFTCIYADKSTGLVEESYFLEKLGNDKTKLIQIQKLISQEVADGYKEGTLQTLELLKKHLEKS